MRNNLEEKASRGAREADEETLAQVDENVEARGRLEERYATEEKRSAQ